jgi:hypothetical protein
MFKYIMFKAFPVRMVLMKLAFVRKANIPCTDDFIGYPRKYDPRPE